MKIRTFAIRWAWLVIFILFLSIPTFGQQPRKVIIDQDASGPGGSNLQAIMTLVQSPEVDPLGITVVTGDQWRNEEVAHLLRLLELAGRTDIPVVPGAEFPLIHTRAEAEALEQIYGKINYLGAWDSRWWHEPQIIPRMPEGEPATKPASEDAPHFMIHMVHQYPHQVTVFEGGPMTDIALAIRLDPQFAELVQQLVFMGGSLNPQSADPEWASDPRHEFNFWFDPEAAHIVLTAHWASITCTPVDISIKTHFTHAMAEQIAVSDTALAKYLLKYYATNIDYMWDELAAAAWINPSIITKEELLYLDVNIEHGPNYGDTLSWHEEDKPALAGVPVHVQQDLDHQKFYQMFIQLMSSPTPRRN